MPKIHALAGKDLARARDKDPYGGSYMDHDIDNGDVDYYDFDVDYYSFDEEV